MQRRVLAFLAFVAVGAALNVAVAWWVLAINRGPMDPAEIMPIPSHAPVWISSQLAGLELRGGGDYSARSVRNLVYEAWDPGTRNRRYAGFVEAGFPMLSLRGRWIDDVPPNVMVINQYRGYLGAGGIHMPWEGWGPRWLPRNLLYEPIFPGFIVNTAFYGLGLWLLTLVPSALRRLGPYPSGRCQRCEYDTTGLRVCPECGEPVRTGAPARSGD